MANLNASYNKVLWQWIDAHCWPSAAHPKSILTITEVSSSRNIFRFRSGFCYFIEVEATYVQEFDALANVYVKLLVPGKATATTLVIADCYPVSNEEGEPLKFNLGNDYVKGSVAFKYENDNITVTYNASLPFAGSLAHTVEIAPLNINNAFTPTQLEGIPIYHDSSLKEIEEKAQSGELVIRVPELQSLDQQELLVKFLQDFVVDNDKIIVETYASSDAKGSKQWEGSISFLNILQLSGSIDPTTFTISALLDVRVPSLGEVYLAGVEGSLKTGVVVPVKSPGAHGITKVCVEKNADERHVLYIDVSLDTKLYGEISTHGKIPIHTLQF